MKSHSSLNRRGFLKALLASLGAAVLAACSRAVETMVSTLAPSPTPFPPTRTATNTPEPSPTATATPTETVQSSQTLTPTPTDTPTPVCFNLLAPPDGAELSEIGRVKFEWQAFPGAAKYRLEIAAPNGSVQAFETDAASYERYLATLTWGGSYTWTVQALDGGGNALCAAGPRSFSKPEFEPTQTKKEDDDSGPMSGGGAGSGGPGAGSSGSGSNAGG